MVTVIRNAEQRNDGGMRNLQNYDMAYVLVKNSG